MDLFDVQNNLQDLQSTPLSARMRPCDLSDYVGQQHILGPDKLLSRAIQADRLNSIILYGPPGVGKTTLANCISHTTGAEFQQINAVSSNVQELRKLIQAAQNRRHVVGKKTVLFIDEIHRFNKAQQDVLMPDIENGNLILIGATVANPFFSLISPLLSRSMIFELKPLCSDDIKLLLEKALKDAKRGLGFMNVMIDPEAFHFIAQSSDGDARRALNALEIACVTTSPDAEGRIKVDLTIAQESIQKKQVVYDMDGDAHYDVISAFIKSMRGSDPDATLYWLAKMLYAGEDIRFIARRICICAAEDVGNADPRALILAQSAAQVSEMVGMPEARIPLAQAAVYIACAPKSNAVYKGINQAFSDVQNKRSQPVPAHLQDGSYAGSQQLERAQGYLYAHDYPNHYVRQEYMLEPSQYYFPSDMGFEKRIDEWLKFLKAQNKG